MDIYWQGVVLAFLIGIVKVTISISALFSTRAKNLSQVGIYYSPSGGAFTSDKPCDAVSFFLYALYMLVLAPLFSWLSVLSAIWIYLASFANRSPTPDRVKEVQFKVARVRLTKEQMKEMISEISTILGLPAPSVSGYDDSEDDPNTYVLDAGEWYAEVTVSPPAKTLTFYSHPPDYDGISESRFEYKIEGDAIACRLLEDSTEYCSGKNWHVKDGVVLESEIRKQCKDNTVFKFDEEVAKYAAQAKWHPLEYYKVRYFVLSRHPEIISHNEWRRIVRSDLERLRNTIELAKKKAQEHGLEMVDTKEGFTFKFPESLKEERKSIFNESFFKSEGTSWAELSHIREHEQDLLNFLGEKVAA